jgi:ribosomal protein S18 acetylase RimI-like enzyme
MPNPYQLRELNQSHLPQALTILTASFQADPLIRHMFPTDTAVQSRPFFAYLLAKALVLQESLLGLEHNGRLVAVAHVETPHSQPTLKQLTHFAWLSLQLPWQISWRNFWFINQYMQVTTSFRPSQPHFYLVFVGVDPAYQGQGCGRILIDEVHGRAQVQAAGVGLDTENPHNVPLYEHLGYTLRGSKAIGSVMVYSLFLEGVGNRQ